MASAEREKKQKQAKQPQSKSKLSKPTGKVKHVPYRIEIASGAIKVIKVDPKGAILSVGSSRYEHTNIVWSEKTWIEKLSQAIREAARGAKVPKGSGFACKIVTGGPDVVMQRFNWPELAHQAMLNNAKHEIASYLPGALQNFVIGAEVQKVKEDAANSSMEVFVAAMSKDMATAIGSAATWAGFKVLSIDIAENARNRFVKKYCEIEGGAPSSYGILDLNNPNPHLTLYLDGLFYSTHYFTAAGKEQDEADQKSELPIEFDVDAVVGEVNFLVDFVRYQERSSTLECILVLGRSHEELTQRLSASLGIPVHENRAWMRASAFRGAKNRGKWIDAYAAAVPSSVIASQHMLDVKTPIIIRNPGRRVFMIGASVASVMAVTLLIAMAIPWWKEKSLERKFNDMNVEAAQVDVLVAQSPSREEIIDLRREIEYYGIRLRGIDAFYREFTQAAQLVPVFFNAEVLDIERYDKPEGFTELLSLSVAEDDITLDATAIHYDHVAGLLQYFREYVPEDEEYGRTLFRAVGTNSVTEGNTLDFELGTATYSFGLTMRKGMGVR
ncbi:MAG: pilus assembly protein PilM [Defluviitaleaceae bacterium]|nr:pilus assembly protein PilM [Defluviitaleaceae bacterium]